MRRSLRFGFQLGCLLAMAVGTLPAAEPLRWKALPSIPDAHGFAGPFAGVIEGDLIVAGGANFPQAPPWEGGAKQWHDRVFRLPAGAEAWETLTVSLPEPRAYGLSVSLPERGTVVFLGGSNAANEPTADVWEGSLREGELRFEPLPSLPRPLAEMSGVALGHVIYLMSGRSTSGTVAEMIRLDLDQAEPAWETLPWPEGTRGRMHSIAGQREGKLYLIGGRDFSNGSELEHAEDRLEAENLDFLRDAHRYDPETGIWQRLADLPLGLSAAPGLAVPSGSAHLLVLGGADAPFVEAQMAARPELNGQGRAHPGFPRTILAYHTVTDTWTPVGEIPASVDAPVTLPVVMTGPNAFVLPSGEIKPGVRTLQVVEGVIEAQRSPFGWINAAVVAGYLLAMVGIGYFFMKRESAASTDAYFRGSQRVPWWVAGLSIFATMLSAITFMGVPAKAYAENFNAWLGQCSILFIVPLVVCFYLPYFRRLNLTSAYEFLEQRFNLATRLVASALFMFFHLGRIAIVLYLPALALSSVTNLNIQLAILAIGLLCILYTVMGGIEAVVWTDAIQAIVLLGGVVLCLVVVIFRIEGGLGEIVQVAQADAKLMVADWDRLDLGSATNSGWVILIGFLFAGLPAYTSGQDVVQRYVTTATEKEAARALWINIPVSVIGAFLFYALGTAIYAFYKSQPEQLDVTLERTDGILPFFILQNLPVGVSGLIVAGIFAAAQSTISSSLNSVATAFVTDFYGRVWKPQSPDARRLQVARRVVLLLGGLGMAVASWIAAGGMKSVFDAYNTFIGMALGPVGGMFFLGVFFRRAGGSSALFGALAGFLTVVILHGLRESGRLDLWPVLNGLISFGVTVLVGGALGALRPTAARSR